MNRTLKQATVRRYHYGTHCQFEAHLFTPYEAICKAWITEPHRFIRDPTQLTSGLNT